MLTSRIRKKTIAAIITAALLPQLALGHSNCTVDAMLVFDGSGSMAEMGFNGLDQPRIYEAQDAMRRSLPIISRYRNLGLIIYGPGKNDLCNNIDLRFSPKPNASPDLMKAIEEVKPYGNTPLTLAVQRAAEVLNYQEVPGEIVLVTDGKETCGGATCQLAAELAATGNQLSVHVIGFQVRGEYFAWKSQNTYDEYEEGDTVAKCLAEYTGGQYLTTQNSDELAEAMQMVLGCAVVGKLKSLSTASFK